MLRTGLRGGQGAATCRPELACSAVVEHCVDIAGVASSILATPTIFSPFETRMIVRPEEEADEPAIRALLKAAFPGPDEARLVDRLLADGSAELSLVAVDGDTIVGHLRSSTMQRPVRALGPGPGGG